MILWTLYLVVMTDPLPCTQMVLRKLMNIYRTSSDFTQKLVCVLLYVYSCCGLICVIWTMILLFR